jgi:hypothetical protein
MTAKSPRKSVDALFWQGRLRQARAFREAAEQAMQRVGPQQNCAPAASQIVLAAIAYGDCLTAWRAQVVNQQDHAAAPRLLRDVLRDTLPAAEEKRYRRILGVKDEVQYGTRATPPEEAQRLLADLQAFARWAEDVLP